MPHIHVHLHQARSRDAGTAHDPKSGQFTSGVAAASFKPKWGMPDHVVQKASSTTHPEGGGKKATHYSVRGRWKQNLNQHHYVTLENETGRILSHSRGQEHAYMTVMGERSKTEGTGSITPRASMRHSSVHAAIQEHIKKQGAK